MLGGTGTISSAVLHESRARGIQATVVTRGTSSRHPLPPGVDAVQGDVRTSPAVEEALRRASYDVVVDFLGFRPEHVAQDVEWFRGRVGQFVFVSSASAYQTPPLRLPITESTPLRNPYWAYSREKIACEDLLVREYRESGFPVTIVRPSHTYDETLVPLVGRWTAIERMRRGAPTVIPGDATNRWTITFASDVAAAFVTLLGRTDLAGEAFHITGDEALTWEEIARTLAEAAGAPRPDIVPVPSDLVRPHDHDWAESWIGDKSVERIFDNTKIRSVAPEWEPRVPFAEGARRIMEWHDADPARRAPDERAEWVFDQLVAGVRG